MRTFIIAMTFYMLDYFKVPVATGSISVLIIIGVTVAVGQDMLEILTFFKEKQ